MTLKRGLTRLEGVADAKLIVKPAHMEVSMKPGCWPDLPRMFATIKQAGYTPDPEKTELRATGKLVKHGDGFALELEGMKTPLALPVVAGPGTATAGELGPNAGKPVQVTGSWQAPAKGDQGPGTLRVTELGPVPAK